MPSDPAVVYIGPLARPARDRPRDEAARARPPALRAVPVLSAGSRSRGLGTVARDQGAGARRHRHAAAGHARADLRRDDARRGGRDPARDSRRLPQGRRPGHRRPGRARSSASRCPCSGSGCCSRCSSPSGCTSCRRPSRLSLETSVLDPIPKITGFYLVRLARDGRLVRLPRRGEPLVLPTITLAAYPAALITRMTRAAMLDVLGQDYIRTARTFGLGERLVLWRLALRNAMPTTLTVSGLSLAYLLTGSFFVEIVFDWPGIGQYATNALLNLDYPAIMGITLLGAFVFLVDQPRRRPPAGEARPADQAAMSVSLDSPEQLPERVPLDRDAGARAPQPPAGSGRAASARSMIAFLVLDRARCAAPGALSRPGARRGRRPRARSRAELGAPLRHRPPRPRRPQPRHLRRPPGARRRARRGAARDADRRAARDDRRLPRRLAGRGADALHRSLPRVPAAPARDGDRRARSGRACSTPRLALAISWWPWYARLARTVTQSLKHEPFIDAARVFGVREPVILARHVLRNATTPILVQATIDARHRHPRGRRARVPRPRRPAADRRTGA